MVVQEFDTLDEFDSIDKNKFKEFDRIVTGNLTFIPTDTIENALFIAYIKEYKKFIVIKNESYKESWDKWKEKKGKR